MRCIPFGVLILSLICLSSGQRSHAGENADASDSSSQIAAAANSYAAAFNARDAEQLAAHWSPEGIYTNRSTGEEVVGREAIQAEFTAMFAEDNVPQLAVATETIELISPNVALERGTATVTDADDAVLETRYSVIYVRRDGRWLIDRVTEDEAPAANSHYEHLQALEPLIGEWSHQGEEFSVEIACRWTTNQNYISRTYKIRNGEQDQVESSGLQIIGWDPATKQIRSWLFDSDGGFVQGTWIERDDEWVVSCIATLADGGRGSFTTILRLLDDGNLAWKKINQVVDRELLPNFDEIIFVRE